MQLVGVCGCSVWSCVKEPKQNWGSVSNSWRNGKCKTTPFSMWSTVTGTNWTKTSESFSSVSTLKRPMKTKIEVFRYNLQSFELILLIWFDWTFADESEATTSFLALLSTWDKSELDEKLANRVLVSQRAVAKLIRAFDRLLQRNEKITQALKGGTAEGKHLLHLLSKILWWINLVSVSLLVAMKVKLRTSKKPSSRSTLRFKRKTAISTSWTRRCMKRTTRLPSR